VHRRVDVRARIPHPVERVFPYLADPLRWHEFAPAVAHRRQIDPGPASVGTRWLSTDRIGPFRVHFVDRLVERDRNRCVVWDSSSPWNARVTYRCTPDGSATRVHAIYEGDPSGWLLGPLGVIVPGFIAWWILSGDFRRLTRVLDAAGEQAEPGRRIARPTGGSVAIVPGARTIAHELLDGEQLDPHDLRINLREMARLNRLPGGVAASVRATLDLLDGSRDPLILDVGTGSGDYPRRLLRARPVRVIASDIRPEILAVAERNLHGLEGVTLAEADARALPFADESVDIAHASLVVHHLEPDEVVRALAEMRRVARRGVVINDLRRGTVPLVLTALSVLALSRGRYTRHDGVLSARRAYTLPELDDLAASAGLAVARRTSPLWPRVTTVFM